MDLAAVAGNDPDQKHEVLIKYNAPNTMFLRLAALTGEASVMIQALSQEAPSDEPSATKLQEIGEDLNQQLESCFLKCAELGLLVKDMITGHVEQVEEKQTFKMKLKKVLDEPSSSRLARWTSRWISFCLVLSIVIVVFQTMPDLHTCGEDTLVCELAVQRYCTEADGVTPENDPGCYRVDKPTEKLRFKCSTTDKTNDPSCYGFGSNYGAVMGLTCDNSTVDPKPTSGATQLTNVDGTRPLAAQYPQSLVSLIPFRADAELVVKQRKLSTCKRWECDNSHVTFFEFGQAYTALEYLFTITFIFEFVAAVVVSDDRRAHFKNPVLYIELASFLPFFVYEGRRFFRGVAPIYIITPGTTKLLTFLRLLRVFRIFKIQQRIPVTKVLWESISKTSTRLTIPYFMLALVSTLLSFIVFDLEKGEECFYGYECIVAGHNMTNPADMAGSPFNKRYLVNAKGQISSFDDFFSSFWFMIVSVMTIGYGDMEPVSTSGKLVAVIAMIFGACYTAMPLTLVGSQFNKSYKEHKRREALLRTKIDVSKPFSVPQADYALWETFAANHAFKALQTKLKDSVLPMLDHMAIEETVDDAKKAHIVRCAGDMKDVMNCQRLSTAPRDAGEPRDQRVAQGRRAISRAADYRAAEHHVALRAITFASHSS